MNRKRAKSPIERAEFTRPHLEKLCDQLDAEFFTGDALHEPHNQVRMRFYLSRWDRELKEREDATGARALAAIADLLSGKEHDADTMAQVADIVRGAGYEVEEMDE